MFYQKIGIINDFMLALMIINDDFKDLMIFFYMGRVTLLCITKILLENHLASLTASNAESLSRLFHNKLCKNK